MGYRQSFGVSPSLSHSATGMEPESLLLGSRSQTVPAVWAPAGDAVPLLPLGISISSLGILWSLYLRRKPELRYQQPEYARG